MATSRQEQRPNMEAYVKRVLRPTLARFYRKLRRDAGHDYARAIWRAQKSG